MTHSTPNGRWELLRCRGASDGPATTGFEKLTKNVAKWMNLQVLAVILMLSISSHAQIINRPYHSLTDSLYKNQIQTLDSVQTGAVQSYIKLNHQYDSVEQKYNAISSGIQQQVDTLNKINLPINSLVQKLDSLNQLKGGKL